jgi:hypothetical protein
MKKKQKDLCDLHEERFYRDLKDNCYIQFLEDVSAEQNSTGVPVLFKKGAILRTHSYVTYPASKLLCCNFEKHAPAFNIPIHSILIIESNIGKYVRYIGKPAFTTNVLKEGEWNIVAEKFFFVDDTPELIRKYMFKPGEKQARFVFVKIQGAELSHGWTRLDEFKVYKSHAEYAKDTEHIK